MIILKGEGRQGHSKAMSRSFTGHTNCLKKKKTLYLLYGTAPLINFLMLYGVLDRANVTLSDIKVTALTNRTCYRICILGRRVCADHSLEHSFRILKIIGSDGETEARPL